jgi:malonate decarboxylase epsilon subunit
VSIALLFPGQGSHCPGMLHTLTDHPAITRTLEEAGEVLHQDVRSLDSAVALRSTVSVQLALLIAGVATARALADEGVRAEAVAGLSVGAYGAAVHSGVLGLPDAIHLVRLRAEMMHSLYSEGYGLAVIVGLTESQVSALVSEAHSAGTPVYVGNVNAPRQIVIAGSDAGMAAVLQAAMRGGARRAQRLQVSVPSHCPLLEPVAAALRTALHGTSLQQPRLIYVGNVKARALRTASDVAEDLASNIAHGVRWHDATTVLEELGCRLFLEMPPGHVLSDLARESLPQVNTIALAQSTLAGALHRLSRLAHA